MAWSRLGGRAGSHAAERGGELTLDALLEVERNLSEMVQGASDEAARIVERARMEARELESQAPSLIAAAVASLEGDSAAATTAGVLTIQQDAHAEVGRFDLVPDQVVQELARSVLDDFLGIRRLDYRSASP